MAGWFSGTCVREDQLTLDHEGTTRGLYCTRCLDSGRAGFSWRRLRLDCQLPLDTLLRTYALSSDSLEDDPISLMAGSEYPAQALEELFGPPVGAAEELYLSCKGRYLWLAFELTTTGTDDPVLKGIRLETAGDHMTDYLPAIYQQDDFTYRFLSVFDSLMMDMEQSIDDLPRRFDYENTDPEMLRYLASWLFSELDDMPDAELVRRIATALQDYESLCTPQGICRTARRLTGQTPYLIEHAQVDPNDPQCRNSRLYRRLYGDDPYRFFLLLQEDTFANRSQMERFLEKMEGRIPAGTHMELVLLKKCVQLDWHTYLGINSRIGSYIPVSVDENTTIHYDTMIGGTSHD